MSAEVTLCFGERIFVLAWITSGGVNGHSIVPTKSSDMQKMGGECAFCQEKMPIVSVFGIDPMYPFTATIP